jgi:hypothetical protein
LKFLGKIEQEEEYPVAHPIVHSENAVKRWGGKVEDYLPIHDWFDESKSYIADWRHRAMRHHAEGIFMAEKIFGAYIINSDGKKVPVRYIGEQHVMEDLGWIPSVVDYLECMSIEPWMGRMQAHRRQIQDRERRMQAQKRLKELAQEEVEVG